MARGELNRRMRCLEERARDQRADLAAEAAAYGALVWRLPSRRCYRQVIDGGSALTLVTGRAVLRYELIGMDMEVL